MFRCAITKKVSKPGEGQIKLVVETRLKTYYGNVKGENGRLVRDENGDLVLGKIGEGREIVREIAVTQEGYDQYMATLIKAE